MEQWRTCVYDGETWDEYEVSTKGRVRSLNYYRVKGQVQLLKLIEDGDSYLLVNLYYKGKKKRKLCKVHRLVAFTFYDLIPNDNPTEKTHINHIDENKHNNSVENLEWTTPPQNLHHGTRAERISKSKQKRVKCIETGKEYDSITQASEDTGISISSISGCCRGKLESCKGTHWEFVD